MKTLCLFLICVACTASPVPNGSRPDTVYRLSVLPDTGVDRGEVGVFSSLDLAKQAYRKMADKCESGTVYKTTLDEVSPRWAGGIVWRSK